MWLAWYTALSSTDQGVGKAEGWEGKLYSRSLFLPHTSLCAPVSSLHLSSGPEDFTYLWGFGTLQVGIRDYRPADPETLNRQDYNISHPVSTRL